MISRTAERFRKAIKDLPKPVQQQARKTYKLFSQNPHHPSLHFKQIHPQQPIYSVRIDRGYRAVGVRDGDEIVWLWIGSHIDIPTPIRYYLKTRYELEPIKTWDTAQYSPISE